MFGYTFFKGIYMSIKHLVISGGGPLGLRYLGALEKLEQDGFWKVDNIDSIYATSIGSIIGAFICLKYDWTTLNQYIIERPWKDVFKVNAKQLFDSYYNKGLFDKKIAEIIFKPLLKAKNLELTVTLKEFYEFSKIDLHIFTFELNNFETVEMSHKSHPDIELVQALTMSSALPGIFMPTIIEDKCFVDGGVMCNYPLNQCLRDHTNRDEILGIKCSYDKDMDRFKNVTVTTDTSLLEYVICLTINTMNFIRNTVAVETIDNTVKCYVSENPLTLDVIQEVIQNPELRRNLLTMGEKDAEQFMHEKQLKDSI
jgi:predicted acylesterase/phospholipase RssA